MTSQHSVVSSDRFDRDLKTAERTLNPAIVGAEMAESFEEYLEIFDTFYADDVEVSSETETIRGKAKIRSLLFNFLIPLHVMAEVGGLSISIRVTAIPGDTASETHSAWMLDLIGVSGTICTFRWYTLRKWSGSRVVYERHYDHQQIGAPLTFNDLSFNASNSAGGLRQPS
jgi:hypothetical protein